MSAKSLRFPSACVVFALIGCASAPPPVAKLPTSVQVNMNFTAQEPSNSSKRVERGAFSGTPQHVGFYYSVNPDCSSDGLVKTQPKSPPAHGTVEFINAEGFTNFPATIPGYQCNKRKSPGVEVRYTSEKEFVGTDEFVVEGIGPNGKYLQTAYSVQVLAAK